MNVFLNGRFTLTDIKSIYHFNMKIEQFSDSTPVQVTFGEGLSYRKLFYRIDPSFLPFFERIFGNPWRQLRQADHGRWDYYFEARDYNNRFSKFKTLGQIREYNKTQQALIDDFTEAHGCLLWPDEKR